MVACPPERSVGRFTMNKTSLRKEAVRFQQEQHTQAFETELAHFERLKPQLLQQYPGRYVAIYQGAVVAVGDDKMAVWAIAEAALGNVPFCVSQVTADGPRRVRIPSAWVVR